MPSEKCETEEMEDISHAYKRKDAIADGVLIDVTMMARKAGFQIPVAVTSAAWAEWLSVTDSVVHQLELGRLWDLLSVLRDAAWTYGQQSDIKFGAIAGKCGESAKFVRLKAVFGLGDNGEQVLTVMFAR